MDRFLDKIVLINSAVFDLAEIKLDGHTCVIGANNRGKTTLLRTIAFFYNPSNRKSELGIKSVEDDFAKFYFKDNVPSYLIYEVATPRQPFQVIFYKNGSHMSYRFVQGAYDRALYFDAKQQNIPLLAEEVWRNLSSEGIWYSNEMEAWHEYRDVLYGKFRAGRKSTQKTLEQLYLFRGETQSDNIPKIIRDIFLNSNPRFAKELKSDFVKAFITNAVSDKANNQGVNKEYAINLADLALQLGDYLDHFEDIKTFRKTSHERGVIKDKFEQIKAQKLQQRKLATQLGSGVKFAKNQLIVLKEQQKQYEAGLKEQKEALANFNFEKEKETSVSYEKLGSLKGKIELAEIAKSVWDSEAFQQQYQEYLQKENYEAQLKQESQELQILQNASQDIQIKYEQRFNNLDNEKNAYLTNWQGRKASIENQYQKQLNELMGEQRAETDRIHQDYATHQEELSKQLTAFEIALGKLQSEAVMLKKEVHFEDEVKALESDYTTIQLAMRDRAYQLKEQETQVNQWIDQDIPAIREQCATRISKREKADQQIIRQLKAEVDQLVHRIKISPNSFYGYLNKHQPNWMDTIGKVCDEKILFNTDLNPQQAKALSSSLYGIDLDLSQLEVMAKSLEEYQKEVKDKQLEIKEMEDALQHFQQVQWQQRDKEIALLQKKITEGNRTLERLKHEQNLAKQRLEQNRKELANFQQKAAQLREEKLYKNSTAQQENRKENATVQQQLTAHQEAKRLEIEKVTTDYQGKTTTLKEQKVTKLTLLATEKEKQEVQWSQKKSQIEQDRKAELDGKGIDVTVQQQLETSIEKLKDKLQAIERFKSDNWRRDEGTYEHFILHHKPNSIDRLPDFLDERREIKQQLAAIKNQKEAYQIAYDAETEQLREQIKTIEKQLGQFEEGLKSFHDFQVQSRLWHQYRGLIEEAGENDPQVSIKALISQLLLADSKLLSHYEIFKQSTLKLINQFRSNNSFGLKLTDETKNVAYDRLAEEIDHIQTHRTIESVELETVQQKNQLITLIHRQISNLKSQLGKVRKAVNSISADISNSGFTDSNLIVSFEMKVEDTNNRVMLQLEKIANLKEENGQAFNELAYSGNLIGHELDKISSSLLEHLKIAIDDSRQTELRLQDMFELMFSYDDKRNKKTNVTNIDDIGSEGTTVLIKSCIYISLLNFFAKQGKIFNQQTYLHCIIDEVGKISEPYLKTLLDFALERHIYLLNALPNKSKLETYYNYTYKLREVKTQDHYIAKVDRLLSKKISLKDHVS